MSVRVLLCDDQELVRTGLRLILETAGMTVVGEASDGEEAVAAAGRLRPDVVLMDLRMPVLDGVEATRRVLQARTGAEPPKVVILSTFHLDDEVLAALAAGASGYVLKDASSHELIWAIRAAASGQAPLAPRVARQVLDHLPHRRPEVPRPLARRLNSLTDREREVLRLAARGRSNGEIAGLLHLTEASVRTYMSRVVAKLRVRDRVQAVVLAFDAGVVEPGS